MFRFTICQTNYPFFFQQDFAINLDGRILCKAGCFAWADEAAGRNLLQTFQQKITNWLNE
jgi:hypothetical protein